MNISFENAIKGNILRIEIDGRTFIVEPESSIEISVADSNAVFTAEYKPVDLSDAFDEDFQPKGFKEKFLYKATKKFTEKIPDASLYSAVTYEFTSKHSNVIIDFSEGIYTKADGRMADFFDMQPIVYFFPRVESNFGDIKVKKAINVNRKRYIKLYRTVQLFMDYLCFFEVMIFAYYFSSGAYTTKLLTKLYNVSPAERGQILKEIVENIEEVEAPVK